jgi:2-isopropylmalate synthase
MKYQKSDTIKLPDRTWPNKEIVQAPIWCSVDLRDGNQSLIRPMSLEKKVRFFKLLVEMGFKEIEVGFPAASEVEFAFCRYLIEHELIPDDVTIQILTQAREHLIEKSAKALEGAKNVIVHLYNSTSTMQREIVFQKTQEEIIDVALEGVSWVKEYFKDFKGMVRLEYSPESFTQTEMAFAVRICNAVVEAWNPTKGEKVIINLPSTVESATPNIYADQIEWMCRNLEKREEIIVSVHAHNDRGCAVAATELALMAGADRVEGTLLGNGERTGNVDIVTVGLNMYTQGIDPELDFSDVDKIVAIVEEANEISTHVRHPYVGALVYTAFSGSHQDAIKKGMDRQKAGQRWYVPYLPIDPKDVGRDYDAIIRINSQSGKGGISYILESYGYKIPKKMLPAVADIIQKKSEEAGGVLSEREIKEAFEAYFVNRSDRLSMSNINIDIYDKVVILKGDLILDDTIYHDTLTGGGVIEVMAEILKKRGVGFEILDYEEHALEKGADAKAVAYFSIMIEGENFYGVGVDDNITYASIKALISSVNIGRG